MLLLLMCKQCILKVTKVINKEIYSDPWIATHPFLRLNWLNLHQQPLLAYFWRHKRSVYGQHNTNWTHDRNDDLTRRHHLPKCIFGANFSSILCRINVRVNTIPTQKCIKSVKVIVFYNISLMHLKTLITWGKIKEDNYQEY